MKFLSKLSSSNSPPDGRKYRLALMSLLVLLAGYSMTYLDKVFVETFSQLVAGIGMILVSYNGGNVVNKWVTRKSLTGKVSDSTLIKGEADNGNVHSGSDSGIS